MAQILGPGCLIDVRIDVLAIKWLADPIGACSSSSILAVMLAACPPLCPSLSARVRGVHEGFGIAGGIRPLETGRCAAALLLTSNWSVSEKRSPTLPVSKNSSKRANTCRSHLH